MEMINPNDSVASKPVSFELYNEEGNLLNKGQFIERIQLDSLRHLPIHFGYIQIQMKMEGGMKEVGCLIQDLRA